jgi:ABC-type nitrate/sulfonate/bicarbonate transport system permease component
LLIHSQKAPVKKNTYFSALIADSVPSIIIGFVLIIWLPAFSLSSFLFILLISIIQLNSDIIKFIKNVPVDYFDALQSQIHSEEIVRKEIYTKGLTNNLFTSLIKHHKYLWTLLIFFEFANGFHGGLGFLIKLSLDYWNTSLLFTVLTLVIILVFLGEYLLQIIFNRLFPWKVSK